MKSPYEMMEETIDKLYSAITELEEIRDQFSPVHHPIPRWLSIAITQIETGTLWVEKSLSHMHTEEE